MCLSGIYYYLLHFLSLLNPDVIGQYKLDYLCIYPYTTEYHHSLKCRGGLLFGSPNERRG